MSIVSKNDSLELLLNGNIAHSKNEKGFTHSLFTHLSGVAGRSEVFGEMCGIKESAVYAAFWHDLGKATDEFQKRLNGETKTPVDHKGFGALWAVLENRPDIALAIAGHHSGLPDREYVREQCLSDVGETWRAQVRYQNLLERISQFTIPELHGSVPLDSVQYQDMLEFDLHIRMLFSCLVDADYLDTEAHFSGPEQRDLLRFSDRIGTLAASFHVNQERFIKRASRSPGKDETLFELRCGVYRDAIAAAKQAQGIYTMTVPTGGGKTRASLGFALEHARTHNLERVIVALPFTSILDQIAEEYGNIFGKGSVLLHYSGWQSREQTDSQEESPKEARMRFAAENWDAPLILTTTVQLFDSLFSNRPWDCRKLHNLARSVIILDEVQTLPVKYLEPICDALGGLVNRYGATILLSTATQPALNRVPSLRNRVDRLPEITKDTARAFQILKRVKYEISIDKPWEWEEVANRLIDEDQGGMVVVNTKKHALELFDIVRRQKPGAFHLSTYLCGAHRRSVIKRIRKRLLSGEPCYVVSTQIIEAGVDLDFPFLMRAVGPLDRIVQAAGRCNREGRLGREGGKVIVFLPEDNAMPRGSYRIGADHFCRMYRGKRFNPEDPAIFPEYFSGLYGDLEIGKELNEERKRLKFDTVSKSFQMIEASRTRNVFVGYSHDHHHWEGSPAAVLLKRLDDAHGNSRRVCYRRLQPYLVHVYEKQASILAAKGLIAQDTATDEFCWKGKYDDLVGIANEEMDLEDMIF